MRVAITGATGFIGRALATALEQQGVKVWRLVRRPSGAPNEVAWSVEQGVREPAKVEGCDAVIHLAGESIAGGLRWSAAKKARIRESRVRGTERLVESLRQLAQPPQTLLCASAIGYYGDRGEEILTETSAPGPKGFLVQVAREWEAAALEASTFGARVVNLRFGIVLGQEGGALPQMLPLFRCGLGGRLGSGRQWWSWISIRDVVGGILHALVHRELQGPVNFTAPAPVRNVEFTRELARSLRRPAFFAAPAFALRLIMGQMAEEMLLASTRVLPEKLQATSYRFVHPSLDVALAELLRA
ncbi:MAG: TIGR01777 family oxidoreductase [Candidatus Sumerlaeaceae bacterium]|jgi:uncharacterized protein (TIGR01777 family)